GAVVERHPVEKDATDLELAFDLARDRGVQSVTVVGGGGGRVDHFLANVALLASSRFSDLVVDARIGDAHVSVVQGGRPALAVVGAIGSLITLLAVGGDACGVTTTGLQYPLHGATLRPGSSRGVSNVLVSERATVELEQGTLLVIHVFGGTR
ncbi:MAG TPA: thiamine diphosphokinase, partial [Acidimicrobiia bacterium]|nr:thiamine diphosphokinase [Acidimicrobiia bacterium]